MEKPIRTGSLWHVSSTEVRIVSLKPFNLEANISQVLTSDNIPISFNIYFTFKHMAGKTPTLIKQFGSNNEWYDSIVKEPLVNTIENYSKKKTFLEMLENIEIKKEFESSISFGIKDLLSRINIPVELLDIKVNKIYPPQTIIDAAIKTKMLKEESQVEEEKAHLEDLRSNTEKARAKADKSYMSIMGMSIREYLDMKRISLRDKELNNQRVAIEQARESNGSIRIHIDLKR